MSVFDEGRLPPEQFTAVMNFRPVAPPGNATTEITAHPFSQAEKSAAKEPAESSTRLTMTVGSSIQFLKASSDAIGWKGGQRSFLGRELQRRGSSRPLTSDANTGSVLAAIGAAMEIMREGAKWVKKKLYGNQS